MSGSPVAVRADPLYLADDCCLVSDNTRCSLSADVPTCVVPRTVTLSSYGNRTYTAAGHGLWNSLPVQLHNPDITSDIRRQLKGRLFREA